MRLSEVAVEELFNTFDHRIPLDMDERITIIHGPNGFGKTTMLRLIAEVLQGDFDFAQRVPFKSLSLVFDNDTTLIVRRQEARRGGKATATPLDSELRAELHKGSKTLYKSAVSKPEHLGRLNPRIGDMIDSIVSETRVGPDTWEDHVTGEILSVTDMLRKYPGLASQHPEILAAQAPPWMAALRENIRIRLIQTARVDRPTVQFGRHSAIGRRRGLPTRSATVDQYSEDVSRRAKELLAVYGAHSQELDRTFPERLLQVPAEARPSADELLEGLRALEKRREQLVRLGLLDKEETIGPRMTKSLVQERVDVLAVYVTDTQKKLAVFDDMATRIQTFKEILNKRFRYKSIEVSRESGFVISTSAGTHLTASVLSSGEQHEIVMLYELLFQAERGWLVLIDEPEISLHVAWQRSFLEDLKRIVALSPIDVVLATHSPTIIGRHWDLTVELKGPK